MRRLFDGISPFYLGTGLLIFFFALMVGIFSALGGGAIFRTMSTPSGTSPVADSPIDTLTFATSTGIAIVGDADADSITIGFDEANVAADEQCATWEASSGRIEWETCGASGASVALDLGDDGNLQSTGLTEIATTGDTNSIFTEPSDDKLLIALANNWPTSDDVSCTDCINATEVEDIYVFTAGDDMTGQLTIDAVADRDWSAIVTDIQIGDADEGILGIGSGFIGQADDTVSTTVFDDIFVISNPTDQIEDISFMFLGLAGIPRFVIAEDGADLATYNPRSMVIGPAATLSNVDENIQCSTNFTIIDCDTGGSGADLGVQDDVEVGGAVFITSLDCSTGYANGGAVVATSTGELICTDDDVGAGGGDPDQNLFETIDAPSGTDPVADSITDTLVFATSTGITITGDSSADSITIGVDIVDDGDGITATTSSESGLEFMNNELSLNRGCSNGQLQKWTSATESWGCAADSTGGTPSFDAITSGTNTSADMIVDAGATLTLASGGHIEANQLLEEFNNDSGATLFECTAVYVSGFDIPSDNPEMAIADSDGTGPLTMPSVGLLHADVVNGADGFIIMSGTIDGLDTATPEGWAVGDILYVNDSGTAADDDCGNTMTNVRPANTDDVVQVVGVVERVHATNGQIKVIGAGRGNDVPNLADGTFWIGNGSNVATAVTMSGDATISNAGVIAVTEADALAADPSDCAANQFAHTIAANGNLTCSAVDISDDTNLAVSGTLLDLTGDTLSINEGTLTDNNICDYELTGTQIECTTNTKSELEGIITDVADFAEADGDVFTGVHDFGGADSLEIPNAAGGTTVNASGEITIDTTLGTSHFYATSTEMVLTPRYSKALILLAPVAGDDFPLIRIDETADNSDITLVEICYLIRGGTNWTGQIQEGDANGSSGVDVHAADAGLVANTNACIQEFSNAAIDNGDWLLLKTNAVTGDPTSLHITLYYTIDS